MKAKTTEIMKGMMNSICDWLELTMENEEMFNGVLPTLDLELWVTQENRIMFSFFEKSMTAQMVLHKRSAIPEGVRRATLNQEMVRRMINTSEGVSIEKRIGIVDDYAQKLINSEYNIDETRNVIIAGLRGYERLLSLSLDRKNPRWKPLHMAGSWNSRNRRMAKLRAKDNWFKGRAEVAPPSSQMNGLSGDTPLEVGSRQDTTPPGVPVRTPREEDPKQEEEKSPIRMEAQNSVKQRDQATPAGSSGPGNGVGKGKTGPRKGKKRGSGRQHVTLGGKKIPKFSIFQLQLFLL